MRSPSLVDLALLKRADEQCCVASREETHRGRIRTQRSRPRPYKHTKKRVYESRHPEQVHRCEWPGGCRQWVKFNLCDDHKAQMRVRSRYGLPWNATYSEVRTACYRASAGASSTAPAPTDAIGAQGTRRPMLP